MNTERLDRRTVLTRLAEPLTVAAALMRLLDWRLFKAPWPGFPQPFAGQWARWQTLRALIAEFAPDALVETGTFLGLTAKQFATASSIPLYTIEINAAYYHLAKLNLRDQHNVTLICGDSMNVLTHLRQRPAIARPLVYLDAHWCQPLPLPHELRLVLDGWPDVLIAIDDFRVPGDPGYGYDIYDGIPLALEELSLPETVKLAFPAISAREEGGARRGTLYLAQGRNAERALREVTRVGLLRPEPGPAPRARFGSECPDPDTAPLF